MEVESTRAEDYFNLTEKFEKVESTRAVVAELIRLLQYYKNEGVFANEAAKMKEDYFNLTEKFEKLVF